LSNKKSELLWFKFVPTIISLIALCVSFKSCSDSNKAIELSERSFIYDKRPYINIEPKKLKNSDYYIDCISSKGQLVLNIEFEVTNVGKTPTYETKVQNSNVDFVFWKENGSYDAPVKSI